jgi:hypothetical protein
LQTLTQVNFFMRLKCRHGSTSIVLDPRMFHQALSFLFLTKTFVVLEEIEEIRQGRMTKILHAFLAPVHIHGRYLKNSWLCNRND